MMRTSLWLRLYYSIALVIAASFVIMAWRGSPLGETDSLFFPPAAVMQHKGEGLYNFVHERAHIFDLSGKMRFLFYPPGHPLLLSALMIESTGRGAMTALAMICGVTLMFSAWLMKRYWTLNGRCFGGKEFAWGVFGLLGLATYLGAYRLGRPDFTATLIALLLIWIQWDVKGLMREVLCALLLGLLAFTHPVAAFYASTLLMIYYGWTASGWKWLKPLLVICAGGVSVMLACFSLSPHGLRESFEGILLHSRGTLVEGTNHRIFKYWVIHTYASFYGPLFVAALVIALRKLATHWDAPKTRWLVLLGGVGFAVLTQHFVASAWDRSYNLWVFAPLYIALLVAWALENGGWRRWVVGLILTGSSVGYLHTLGVYAVYEKEGYRYEEAKKDFARILEETPGIIGVSKSLWILSEEHQRLRSYGLKPLELVSNPEIIVLQQKYAYDQQPPFIKGYQLVRHNFKAGGTRLLGVQLSPTPPGYNFAVYRKTPTSAKTPSPSSKGDATTDVM